MGICILLSHLENLVEVRCLVSLQMYGGHHALENQ